MKLKYLFLIFITGAAFGQKTETRDLSSFSSLHVGEAITVYITKGSEEKARIETNNVDPDRVQTRISGDRLNIEMSKGNYRNASVKVWLTYRSLRAVSVSSAATIQTENVLKTEKLRLEASSAGDADLEIDVDQLDVSVSSSGQLNVKGRAMFQDISVSSAGRYYAYELDCEEVEASASSSGSARVVASNRIDAKASSAGSIRYKGNPEKVYTDASSGGSVKKSN